jgi:hypothetical protein
MYLETERFIRAPAVPMAGKMTVRASASLHDRMYARM